MFIYLLLRFLQWLFGGFGRRFVRSGGWCEVVWWIFVRVSPLLAPLLRKFVRYLKVFSGLCGKEFLFRWLFGDCDGARGHWLSCLCRGWCFCR